MAVYRQIAADCGIEKAILEAIAVEREACAEIAKEHYCPYGCGSEIAAVIHARRK